MRVYRLCLPKRKYLPTTAILIFPSSRRVDKRNDMAPTTSRTITLDDLTPQNIGVLKRLNTVLFPVPYSEKFYKESLNVGELAKLGISPTILPQSHYTSGAADVLWTLLMIAYFRDVCVGAVRCAYEAPNEDTSCEGRIYIMTLGVLSPYRRYGIGIYLEEPSLLYRYSVIGTYSRTGADSDSHDS